MSPSQTIFINLLDKAGFSLTRQRKAVFETLQGQEPLSLQDIISRTTGKADRASVYRTVELFETIGIIQRIPLGLKSKFELSDSFSSHHHHISCLGCGSIKAIHIPSIESFIERLGAQLNYNVTDHQLEIQGYCVNCSQKVAQPLAGQPKIHHN